MATRRTGPTPQATTTGRRCLPALRWLQGGCRTAAWGVAVLALTMRGCSPTRPADAANCDQLIPLAVDSARQLVADSATLAASDFDLPTRAGADALNRYHRRTLTIEARSRTLGCDTPTLDTRYHTQLDTLTADTDGGRIALQTATHSTPFTHPDNQPRR